MTEADRASSSARLLRLGAGSLVVALGLAIAVAAATQVPAGAGAPSPDKTIPTLPPTSGDVPATVTDTSVTEPSVTEPSVTEPSVTESSVTESSVTESSVTESSEVVVPPSTDPDLDSVTPLRAGAGPPELFAAAVLAVESDDVAACFSRLVAIPSGIPTPAGTTILTASVTYSAADPAGYVATAGLSTSANVHDVTTFYATMLTAAGYVRTDDTGDVVIDESVDPAARELTFASTDPAFPSARVAVEIAVTDHVAVVLRVTNDGPPEAVQAFAGWPAGFPTLDDGRPTVATLTASTEGATVVSMSATFAYDGVSVDELTTRTRDGLANGGGGFRIAADDEGGSLIVLEHPVIGRATAEILQDSGVTVLELQGSLS